MKNSTIIVIVLALLLLLLFAFTPLTDYYETVRNVDDMDAIRSFASRNLLNRDLQMRSLEAGEKRVVVSLTTIPDRIQDIKYTIVSLIKQTVKPDEIALNIPYRTLKGKEYQIPPQLERLPLLKIYRLEEDLGPATKLLPTLKREHPDTQIIVADDDVVYSPMFIEKLKEASDRYPENAVTTFGKKLRYRGQNEPPEYGGVHAAWFKPLHLGSMGKSDYVMGVYGFVVKPRFFDEDIFHFEDKPPETIWVDDMHISGQLSLRGIDIITPTPNINLIPLPILKQQRSAGLFNTRNNSGRNDNIVIKYYWERGAFRKPIR